MAQSDGSISVASDRVSTVAAEPRSESAIAAITAADVSFIGGHRLPLRLDSAHQAEAESPELLRAQVEILELITIGEDLDKTLLRLVGLIEQTLKSFRCSIQLLDFQGRRVRCMAAPDILVSTEPPKGDPTDEAEWALDAGTERQGLSPSRVGSLEAFPPVHPEDLGMPHGYHSCSNHPIMGSRGERLGELTFYSREDRNPNPGELAAINGFGRLARIAIEHERRERSRRYASKRFGSLAANVPGVVYQLLVAPDGQMRFTYLSAGIKDLCGLSHEQAIAEPQALIDCYESGYGKSFHERRLEASRSLSMWDVEAKIYTLDGERKYTHDFARPHRQPDGTVLWDGIILDATRMKEAELELREAKDEAEASSLAKTRLLEKLRAANERFEGLAASVPGVVYQRKVSPDGQIRYTYISDGVKDIFGLSPEEILADSQLLFDCHGPEYRKKFRERLLAASEALTMWDVEAEIITPSGDRKYTHAIARPHREPDGSVVWDGIILDATRMKDAELELRGAKERAEESSRAKTAFLAAISHELRTPLNVIIGFSEMVRDEHFGPIGNNKYNAYARDINKSGHDLLSKIEDILEFTKFESDGLQLKESEIGVRSCCDAAVKRMGALAEAARVNVEVQIHDETAGLICDRDKVERLLTHVISNAIKFTPENGDVRIETIGEKNGGIALKVSDTGIGMAPEHIPKAYEIFSQVDGALSRKFEGIGLGVPLAAAIARAHGASLSFDSELNAGTTVTIGFPAARVIEI